MHFIHDQYTTEIRNNWTSGSSIQGVNMRTILSFAALVAIGLAIPTTDHDGWTEFKASFGKVYSDPTEELMRKEIVMKAKAQVDEHNALFAAGLSTFEMALNHLSDLAPDEFEAKAKGLKLPELEEEVDFHQLSGESVPAEVDWRKKNAVTPVKNQDGCGCCFAFSATGCLEGLLAIKTNKLVSLSEQEIIDCPFNGCHGCNGGFPWSIFKDLTNRVGAPRGLESEANYPYTGQEGTCAYNKSEISGTDSGYKKIPTTEDALKDAVASIGPISVAISTAGSFRSYNGGIFNDPECPIDRPDHAVLVVGYGEENGQAYWIVKNSWGAYWGEAGYIRMAIGSNLCGIADFATYPIVG